MYNYDVLLLTVSGGPPGGPGGGALSWRLGGSGAPGALISGVERGGGTTADLAAGDGKRSHFRWLTWSLRL